MTEQPNDRQAAASARAAHYESMTAPVGRTEHLSGLEERSAVGDFAYQVGVNLTAGAGVAGIVAAAKVVAEKVAGDNEPGKHEED